MKKIIAFCSMLLALCAGATNITNYPVRTTFNANYWFLLSDVAAQTNWNLPGNYVASTTDLNSASNVLWQLYTNANVWTNNGRYVWLAGQKAPNPSDLTNGPPLFLTTNGDQYLAGDQHVMGNVYIGNSNAVLNIWTNFASWPLTFNVVGQGQFIATNTVFGPILDLHGSTNSEASFWIANHKTNGEVSISLRNDEGSASATSGRRSFISYLAVQDWGVPTYVTWETTMNAYGTHPWHIDWIPIDDGAHRNEYLTILTNGYVGIGATTPGYRLEVNGLAKADNIITPTNTPTDGYVLTATGTGGASKWAAASTNILTVYIDSAWITNLYVDNGWITNLYSDIAYITNLYTDSLTVTNLNVTNLFAGDIETTNLYTQYGWITNLYTDRAWITNLYANNGWITNLYSDRAWITNLYANNAWITNLYVSNGFFDNITITNGLTNLSLTPNTVLKSDANRRVTSIPNGTGALTNDGAGVFGWASMGAGNQTPWLSDINGSGYSLYNALNVECSNVIMGAMLRATNGGTNWLGGITTIDGNTIYSTNLFTMAPDFNYGNGRISTNASFTFLAPLNVDANKDQTTVMTVKNTSGSPIKATEPQNVHVVPGSVMWITNVTKFTFNQDGFDTNLYAVPTW